MDKLQIPAQTKEQSKRAFPELLTDSEQLARFCEQICHDDFIAVDTEFMRGQNYYPEACLIQLAGRNHHCVVDCKSSEIDLSPVYALMLDEDVLKVFHSAEQDIELLFWLMKKTPPCNIFDTQIAAMVCGFEDKTSYARLVFSLLGISLDKREQLTNWARRPLRPEQIRYALADVIHLRQVYQKLKARMEELGRSHWLDEEMKNLTLEESIVPDPKSVWQRIRAGALKPTARALLQRLAETRERIARRDNLIRSRICSDQALLEFVRLKPSSLRDYEKISLLTPSFFRRKYHQEFGRAIVQEAYNDTHKNERHTEPQREKNTETRDIRLDESLCELLRIILRHRCAELGIAPRLVATKEELQKYVSKKNGEDATGNASARFMNNWRYDVFGSYAEKFLNGEMTLCVGADGLEITPRAALGRS